MSLQSAEYVNNTLWKDTANAKVRRLRFNIEHAHPSVQAYGFVQKLQLFQRKLQYQPARIVLTKMAKKAEKTRKQGFDFQYDIFPSQCCMRPIPCAAGSYCQAGVQNSRTEYQPTSNFNAPQWCVPGTYCGRGSQSPKGSGPCPAGFYCPSGSESPRPCWKGHECPMKGNKLPVPCASGKYSDLGVFPPKTLSTVTNIQSLKYVQYNYKPNFGARRCVGQYCCSTPCFGCIPPGKPDGHWLDCGYYWTESGGAQVYQKMTTPICSSKNDLEDERQGLCICLVASPTCVNTAQIKINVEQGYDGNYLGKACAQPYWCVDKSPLFDDIETCRALRARNSLFGCVGEDLAKASRTFYGGNYDWDAWPVDTTMTYGLCYNKKGIIKHGQICPPQTGTLPLAYDRARYGQNAANATDALTPLCVNAGVLGSLTCPNKLLRPGRGVVNMGDVTLRGSVVNDVSGLLIEQTFVDSVQNSRSWGLVKGARKHHPQTGTTFSSEMCNEGSVRDCDNVCLSDADCSIPGATPTPCARLRGDGVCHDGSVEAAPGFFPNFNCEAFEFDASNCTALNSSSVSTWQRLEAISLVATCYARTSCSPFDFGGARKPYVDFMAYISARSRRVWFTDMMNRAIRERSVGPVFRANNPSYGAYGGGRPLEHYFCTTMNIWRETQVVPEVVSTSLKLAMHGENFLEKAKFHKFLEDTVMYSLNCGLGQMGFINSGQMSIWPSSPPTFVDQLRAPIVPGLVLQFDANLVGSSEAKTDSDVSLWVDTEGLSSKSWHVDDVWKKNRFSWHFGCDGESLGTSAVGAHYAKCFRRISQQRPNAYKRAFVFPSASAFMGSLADISTEGTGDQRVYNLHHSNATIETWFRLHNDNSTGRQARVRGRHVLFETGRDGWGTSILLHDATLKLVVHWVGARFDPTGIIYSEELPSSCSKGQFILETTISRDAKHNFQHVAVTFSTGRKMINGQLRNVLRTGLYMNGLLVQAHEANATNFLDVLSWSDGTQLRGGKPVRGKKMNPCLLPAFFEELPTANDNATNGTVYNRSTPAARVSALSLGIGLLAGLGTIGEAEGVTASGSQLANLDGAAGAAAIQPVERFRGEISMFRYYTKTLTPNEVYQNYVAVTMAGLSTFPYRGTIRTAADNLVGSTRCAPCPYGYYCPQEGTAYPIPCPAGKYRSAADAGSLVCLDCPEGTYSTEDKLVSKNECKPCPPGKVCEGSGNQNLNVTDQTKTRFCPEGYFCQNATTKATEREFPCPRGTFCTKSTLPPADFNTAGEWDIKKCDCTDRNLVCKSWSGGGFQCDCVHTVDTFRNIDGLGMRNLKGYPQCDDDAQSFNAYQCIRYRRTFPNRFISFILLSAIQEVCNWRYTGKYPFGGGIDVPINASAVVVEGEPVAEVEVEMIDASTVTLNEERMKVTGDCPTCCHEELVKLGGCLHGTLIGKKGTIMYGIEKRFNALSELLEWMPCARVLDWETAVAKNMADGKNELVLTDWCRRQINGANETDSRRVQVRQRYLCFTCFKSSNIDSNSL